MGAGVALAPFSPASSASTMDVRAVQCGRTTTPLAPPTSQAALVAGTNPLLLALQQNVKAPYLDPTEPDSWTQFEREWAAWSQWYLVHKPPGPDGEVMHRALLISRLHPTLQGRYQEEVLRHTGLTVQMIWNDLSRNFGVDNPHFWRKKWYGVQLQLVEGELTLANWKLYQSKFETALAKVTDWTDTEVADKVKRQLPTAWVDKVTGREAKDAKEKHLIKFENCPCAPQTLVQGRTKVIGPINKLIPLKGCIVGEFATQAQAHALLAMQEFLIGGTKVTLLRQEQGGRHGIFSGGLGRS